MGETMQDGSIAIPFDEPLSDPATVDITLCSKQSLRLSINSKDFYKTTSEVIYKPDDSFCKTDNVTSKDNPIIAFAGWMKGQNPSQLQDAEKNREELEKNKYMKSAKEINASFPWLIPLPEVWSVESFNERANSVLMKMQSDLEDPTKYDLRNFICKTPDEVGPTPNMDLVDRFISEFPGSVNNRQMRNDLLAATKAGNWLAISQYFSVLSQTSRDDDKLAQFHLVQIMEWLQTQHLGVVYRVFGEKLAASGYWSDVPNAGDRIEVFAALHQSYPSQFKLGKELSDSSDQEKRAIGKKMVRCALGSTPGYAKALLMNPE